MAEPTTNGQQLALDADPDEERRKATARRLGGVLKSARDVMRKDKGISSDVERLPMLTWIMFLKLLDDMERGREEEAALQDKDFRPIVQPPYRWRDWAADEDGITGPELLAFVEQDEATLPNGEKGPGLIKYLRELEAEAGDTRKRVVEEIFSGVVNRMINGYLLRDVVNLVDQLHFDSSQEVHLLSDFYETMLRELRDAAGSNGEFYTPRPVVEFIVEVMNPRLGEEIEDPACGTGGFLVEAYNHLEGQCETVKDRDTLQHETLYGGEAKPLPYMLGQMNLLLHGLEAPDIHYGNSLKVRLQEMGDRDRVDAILTNPPFGGEEEPGIQNGFPADRQTAETALLFLQLIMRKLRRPGHQGRERGGRAAVVVPNGTLFADGVAARIKEDLLTNFRLHTVVRLPEGTFAPYTDIPANVLFFERSGGSDTLWYYQVPLPEDRSKYTKTKPMPRAALDPVRDWWDDRAENEHAWKVRVNDLIERDDDGKVTAVNLDLKHPDASDAEEHRPPGEIAASVTEKEERIAELMHELRAILGAEVAA
jgi:type I restriction enzyme M protein